MHALTQTTASGLAWLARHGTRCLAAGVLVGLAVPPLADFARPALAPAIVVNMTIALLRLDPQAVIGYLRRPGLLALFTGFALLVEPVLVLLAARRLGLPPGLVDGLVLMAAAPPIMSAAAFALIMQLDAAFAIATVVLTHALVPLTLPPLALWLLGIELDIGLLQFAGKLALLIGSAFLAAFVLRRWVFPAELLERSAAQLDGLAVIGLVVFAVAIMAGVTEFFIARPGFALLTIAVAFVANAALQVVGAVLFRRAGWLVSLTAGHMTGNCNMGLVLAVLAGHASTEVAVFFALAQLPMYMLPMLAMSVYRRLLRADSEA
jgi:BASS family bile acid:Na+ symporter